MDEDHHQPVPGLYTLREAAVLTGLTIEALRLRVKRGKLEATLGMTATHASG